MPNPNLEDNLWSQVLNNHCCYHSNNFSAGNVLILGDDGNAVFGKRPKTETDALQFQSFVAENEKKFGETPINVWALNEPSLHSNLLKFSLNEANFEKSIVLFCASMSEPWNLIETLENKGKLLESHLNLAKIPLGLMKSCQKRERKFWSEYHTTNQTKHVSHRLDKSILTKNFGIPIVVVITRCDFTSLIEKEFLYDQERFDFIQENLRWFCLKYGASLVYLNDKEENGYREILLKYILHRIGGNPIAEYVCFTEKHSVFIPAGWDDEKKIAILSETYRTIDSLDDFNEHIRKPIVNKTVVADSTVEVAEDDQEFLARIQPLLNDQVSPLPKSVKSEKSAPASSIQEFFARIQPLLNNQVVKSENSSIQLKPIISPLSKKAENAKNTLAAASSANQESILTNYFNKLNTHKSKPSLKSTKIAEKLNDNMDSATIDAQVEYLMYDMQISSSPTKQVLKVSGPKHKV